MKLLVVEDDKTIASGLEYSLEQEGFDVILCHNVSSAKEVIEKRLSSIALCILDLSLPDGSGYELCQLIKEKSDTPVLFLTVVDDEVNVVLGLDMGADDYITKPFRIRELLSRINSVLRRYKRHSDVTQDPKDDTVIKIGDLSIHPLEGKVFKDKDELFLTALEYRLLMIFANHLGQVLTRSQLLELIWDAAGDFVNDNTLTVYIKRLREKMEDDPQNPLLIQTVRGIGYRIGEQHVKK
ncbi:response regulator transcription factor [Alkalihalobacillus trypoxylicola]|uniref:Two-component system response regulator n=1 Tax=Alkalihalobacillus trypoxylicola TaxID=519424 RepID=A0A161PAZ6_9BACI|nr:response regulator transcription factor [Alkalihalobacillus trypoxylicola]KYG29362.1 two-component system response regulator [Alkalihalobacillus trypoxylicola]